MVAKNIKGRQIAFDALEKLIADGEPIRFLELSKKIGVPATTVKRVFNENFRGQGVIGRSQNATKVIKEIIDSGVTDVNQIKNIARNKYKINIDEKAIKSAVNLATDFSVEQYADDYRKMTSNPRYVPKYVVPATTKGMTANQKEAKKIVKSEVSGFEEKLLTNVNKRKKLKRAADPEKRAYDLATASERRTTRRIKEGDVALTEAERKINLDQRKYTKEILNNPIRKNPLLVLNNENLMNRLSTTVSKDGDIIRLDKPPGITKESLTERGLFEIDHQRDIYKKGKMKNLPYNRNPIMGPHNRSNGFKAMAERYIKKNPDPNDPKVKNILRVAEELKVTLQPDIPEGIFKTKGIGYKQIGGPVEKFKNFAEPILNEIGAVSEKIPKKGKLGLAAAGTLALTGAATAEELPIKYNDEIGAFVDPKTDDKVSQATLLDWAANNPMPTAAVASAPLLSKTVRKGAGKLLSGLLSTLGSSTAGLGFAGMTVKGNLDEGKNIVDATVDPMVGIELLYPEAAKRFGGKGLQNALGRALSLGRVGAMMTPVGMGITALGIGKELYNIAQEEQDRIDEMRENDPMAYQEYLKEQQELMDVSA